MDSFVTIVSAVTADRSWGIDIPNYFWFTGSSSAAFIIANFYIVFGLKKYKPYVGFLLLVSLAFLFAAPINLIDDLKQPGRIYNFFLYGWDNFSTSPMKWGVLFLMWYFTAAILQVLMFFRPYFIKCANEESGIFKKVFQILSFGSKFDENKNKKIVFILGIIGIPASLCVDGYTGYIIGAVHANVLWSTPIMPILFLVSAMVSGIAFVIFLLPFFQRYFTDKKTFDKQIVANLAIMLSIFIIFDLILRAIWLSFSITFSGDGQYMLSKYFDLHFVSTVYIEYILCLIIPMFIGFSRLRYNMFVMAVSGIVVTIGVWLFRFDTVIAGQGIPKSVGGFLEYTPEIFGANSITSVLSNWLLFIGLMLLFLAVFPWQKQMDEAYNQGAKNE